jgi:ubiquinone/menaquinone biosynthesis C-methylase UbiE
MTAQPAPPDYVLGRSEKESQRLVKQSVFMRQSTDRVFRKAGLGPGMRVLDIGCGVGDVSFLAAEHVGPAGSVLGVDRDPGVLLVARERAKESGLTNVTFAEGEIDRFTATDRFDAVVGRFVLMYQADPVETLANLSRALKATGLLVVQEPNFGVAVTTWPEVALWQRVNNWIVETFRRAGTHHDIGGKLYHLFRQAGLPGPSLIQHVTAAGGTAVRPLCENSAGLVSSLLPRMEKFGIASAEQVQVETLAERLEQETCAAEAQVTYVPSIAAWTRVGRE